MRDVGLGDKVYTPDLQTYELEGPTGIFGTVASILVGPLRLVLRVVHNIMILPAHLLRVYAEGLFIASSTFAVIGLLYWIFTGRWFLFVSELPMIGVAFLINKRALNAMQVAEEKRKVEINTKQVEELCNSIYEELDAAQGEEK